MLHFYLQSFEGRQREGRRIMNSHQGQRGNLLSISKENIHFQQNSTSATFANNTRGARASSVPLESSRHEHMNQQAPRIPLNGLQQPRASESRPAGRESALDHTTQQNGSFGEFYEILFTTLMKEDGGPNQISNEEIRKLAQCCRIFNRAFCNHFLWSELEESFCCPELIRYSDNCTARSGGVRVTHGTLTGHSP